MTPVPTPTTTTRLFPPPPPRNAVFTASATVVGITPPRKTPPNTSHHALLAFTEWSVLMRVKEPASDISPNGSTRSTRIPFHQRSDIEHVNIVDVMEAARDIARLADDTFDTFLLRYVGEALPREAILREHRATFRQYKTIYHGLVRVFGDSLLRRLIVTNRTTLAPWVHKHFTVIAPVHIN